MEDKQKLQWYILITSTTLPKRQYKSKYNITMDSCICMHILHLSFGDTSHSDALPTHTNLYGNLILP